MTADYEWRYYSKRGLHWSLPVDHIAGIFFRGSHREVVFRVVERKDSIKGFSLFDVISDLLKHFDARSLVEGGAGCSRQSIETKAIDGANDAIAG